MTFTLPEDLAAEFLRRVPARNRSRYVSEAIAAKLGEAEERLIRSSEVANGSADILAVERDWEGLADESDRLAEPWTDPASR
jgi:ubiquinone biosynthesis protein UbiJ